ncbi:MAG: histidine kinase [Treponema sp.]|nr:histidine kinase [Treponema sp.]
MLFFTRIWYRAPLKNKLVLFFIPLIGFVLLLTLYTAHLSYSYSQSFHKTLASHYRINNFLSEIRLHNNLLERFIKNETVKISEIQRIQLKSETILHEMNSDNYEEKEAQYQIRALNYCFETYLKKTYETINLSWEGLPYYQSFYQTQRVQNYMEQYIYILQNILFTSSQQAYAKKALEADVIQWLMITIFITVMIVMIRLVIIFANKFTSPIRHLAELSSRIASGDLNVPLVPSVMSYGDEISILSEAFNKMSRSIKIMVDNLRQKSELEKKLYEEKLSNESAQRALRESQLVSLQSQIKPHFLFNTLNTIQRQAELEDALQTQSLIKSLASLFRFNLLSHQQTVFAEQEVLAVKEYVKLQQKRFGKRIQFKINVNAPLDKISIPPFVLLTFVENAIGHGLEPKIEGGNLHLNIKIRGSFCVFRIFDNGVGMPKEDKDKMLLDPELIKSPEMSGKIHGIGVKNSLYRLHLLFGGKEKFALYSREGKGSLVVISVPYINK